MVLAITDDDKATADTLVNAKKYYDDDTYE